MTRIKNMYAFCVSGERETYYISTLKNTTTHSRIRKKRAYSTIVRLYKQKETLHSTLTIPKSVSIYVKTVVSTDTNLRSQNDYSVHE